MLYLQFLNTTIEPKIQLNPLLCARIVSMTLSQKVAFNTLIQVFSKVITVGLTLLTTILLTGYLGKEGYGNYIYVINLAIIFGALADWGTATIGVREVSKEKGNQGKILGNIFILRLLFSFLAVVLLLIVSFFLPSANFIRIASLIVFLVAIRASFTILFQSRLEMQKTAMADIATSALIFIFSWYVVQKNLGLGPLIWAVIWAAFLAVLMAGIFALKTIKYEFVLDKKILKRVLIESLPMGAILLMFTIDNKIDTVMLGSIKGSGPVGIYGLSSRVYDVLILGAAYLMNALLPVISKYADIGIWRSRLADIYQKTFDVLLLIGLAVVILIYFLAPLMIKILTQQRYQEFSDSVGVLKVASLAMFFAYFNHLTGYTIVALGKQKTYFWIASLSLGFNIIANLIFIPRFSYWGAAWVTVLTEGLVLIITSIFIFRLIKVVPSISSFPKTAIQLIKNRGKIF